MIFFPGIPKKFGYWAGSFGMRGWAGVGGAKKLPFTRVRVPAPGGAAHQTRRKDDILMNKFPQLGWRGHGTLPQPPPASTLSAPEGRGKRGDREMR